MEALSMNNHFGWYKPLITCLGCKPVISQWRLKKSRFPSFSSETTHSVTILLEQDWPCSSEHSSELACTHTFPPILAKMGSLKCQYNLIHLVLIEVPNCQYTVFFNLSIWFPDHIQVALQACSSDPPKSCFSILFSSSFFYFQTNSYILQSKLFFFWVNIHFFILIYTIKFVQNIRSNDTFLLDRKAKLMQLRTWMSFY